LLDCVNDIPKKPIDVIFHLAAKARIQPSFDTPWETYTVNSTGTIVALEMAKYYNAKFIYAGSSSAFSDVFSNPYAYSKSLGEQHCKLYAKLYDISTVIARFFNVYGPRQIEKGSYATVMGVFERQWRENKPLTVTGDGQQRRDMTHVSDIIEGLLAMSKDRWYGEIFSLGTGTNYSINEIAAMFKHPVKYIPKRKGEAETTLASLSFTRKMLGWKAKIKISDYIAQAITKK
jgi:UDP-glucose 4-epimerase